MRYRITTNGHEFRIEVKAATLFGRIKWYPLRGIGLMSSHVLYFDGMIAAENALAEIKKRDARELGMWVPVGEP